MCHSSSSRAVLRLRLVPRRSPKGQNRPPFARALIPLGDSDVRPSRPRWCGAVPVVNRCGPPCRMVGWCLPTRCPWVEEGNRAHPAGKATPAFWFLGGGFAFPSSIRGADRGAGRRLATRRERRRHALALAAASRAAATATDTGAPARG